MTEALLSTHNLGYRIDDKPLVFDVSLRIYPNDVLSLIGPNGAGKSTLIKLILGLLTPSTGKIERKKNLRIGYVPQKFSLPSILPLRTKDLLKQNKKSPLTQSQTALIYEILSLDRLVDAQVATLSGGELQRVLLAKALLEQPELLVLDEPMQGLDPEAQTLLYKLIDSLPDFLRCAMLVVSHDLHWVMKGTKQVICLNKHICCQGAPADIAKHTAFIELFGSHHSHLLEAPYIHHHDHCEHTEQ